VKLPWEKQVKEPHLLDGEWEKPSTSDADDAAEEHTTLRKSNVQPAATEHPTKLGGTHGRLKIWSERGSTSSDCYSTLRM